MQSVHHHPNPTLNRITQYGAAVLLVIMVVGALGLVALGLADVRFRLLIVGGLITLLLIPPVLMLTTITPPVEVGPDALVLRPVLGPPVRVPWDQIAEVKDYPLLPPPDSEIGRKMLSGRKRYRPAEGRLLVIPSLPARYRVNGFFCGEGLTPVIGITNRSHADYDKLVKKLAIYIEESRS